PVLQAKDLDPVPPLGVAVSVAAVPAHASLLFTETVGFGFDVIVPVAEPVHPFVSVTVTEYVPVVPVLIVEVVAPVLHAYEREPVPPLGEAVSVAFVPAHASGLLTVTSMPPFDVNIPDPDPVHPLVSVTVTEYVPVVLVLIVEVV